MRLPRSVLVTGGAGFVGGHFLRYLSQLGSFDGRVVNLDKLTYAGNQKVIDDVEQSLGFRYTFVHGDIADAGLVASVLLRHEVDTIVHLAAESHVDRTIAGPSAAVATNMVGTAALLEAARSVWKQRQDVRFHHVSTDEVYGSLPEPQVANEQTTYSPNSPYSATKAASDHLVRAWHVTYGLPVTLSHCSNNFGPYQYPEKLIPLMIERLRTRAVLPVYGDGLHVRDWIHVEDHVAALWAIVTRGQSGEVYNIGGATSLTNLALIRQLAEHVSKRTGVRVGSLLSGIRHVEDRPGHDRRYAIDTTKIRRELDWNVRVAFTSGLAATVDWYLENPEYFSLPNSSSRYP